ncbi:hypothetical protein KI809_10500 [Geobacter pelophilus]|uniref:Ribbon-helix-helix protein, copG family n=1 Tax=Geoanaerobacter pelophilus TaxID=60036 RepID=A0AAW4L0Y1_9BACT|nr:hypothetical protein [Geoanaerobacter pelophilus]MBT0664729.1 hypothetical protein [Geoanaerobacter pelophilus]
MGRKRKYTKSYVISIRVSEEEFKDLNLIMETMQIKRVSDMMRQALGCFRDSSASYCRPVIKRGRLQPLRNFA